MHTLSSKRVRFGAFELDLSTGELRSVDAPDPINKDLLREQVSSTYTCYRDALKMPCGKANGSNSVPSALKAVPLRTTRSGEKESDAALKELIEKFHANAAWSIATVYAQRNERDEAFKWIDCAYSQHDGGLIFLRIDPLLKNLHNDPRYTAFLNKLHLPTT